MKFALCERYRRLYRLFAAVMFVFWIVASAGAQTSFIRENAPTFMKTILSNGIPIYMKVQDANRVFHVSLVLQGGSLVTPLQQAGWENVTLKTMARSSQHYTYERAAAILDRTSSNIGTAVQFEYSTFSLTTLDKYRDELLALWGDMLTAPSFASDDFEKAKDEVSLSLQGIEQNPWSTTQKVMNQTYFKGHPYAANPEGTEESVSTMTAADARKWYVEHFSADRIFVVAVGNFNPAELAKKLEALLGQVSGQKLGAVPQPPPFPMGPSGSLIMQGHEQAKGTLYLRGDFAAPAPGSSDYFAMALAARMFSDMLFSVVRDKYGAVYTPSAMIRSFSANYGSIMIYKTNVPDRIKQYIDEAAGLIARGRVVSVDPAKTESDGYMPISEAVDTYKQLYMNEYFEAVRSNAAIASLMIGSVLRTGDPADWLKDQKRIETLDADAVQHAFNTYVLGGAFLWVAVGDQTLLDKLDQRAFEAIRF